MKMWRRALCVSGRADVTEHGASGDAIAFLESGRILIEMRVVVNTTTGADHGNGLAAETVLTDVVDKTAGGGEDRSALWREDVLAFVAATGTAWRAPCVGDLPFRNVFQRHGEPAIRLF